MSTRNLTNKKPVVSHRGKPLYCQIREELLQRLAEEYWRPGQMLPSEMQLAKDFNVSQGTMRRAIDDIARQGLLDRHQGRGTSVPTHDSQRALFRFFHLADRDGLRQLAESKALRLSTAPARPKEAEKLDLKAGDTIIRICRLRFLNSKPTIIERIVVPHALFTGLENTPLERLPNTIYEYYERRYNVTVINAVEKLGAVSARPTEARHLQVPVGTPLLEIIRVSYSHLKQPIELRMSRVLTSDHRYVNVLE